MDGLPGAGDVVYVSGPASVQFDGARAFYYRVIRLLDWSTYTGWCWLDGYQLNRYGEAVERRRVFIQPAGLVVKTDGKFAERPSRRTRNAGPSARPRKATKPAPKGKDSDNHP